MCIASSLSLKAEDNSVSVTRNYYISKSKMYAVRIVKRVVRKSIIKRLLR